MAGSQFKIRVGTELDTQRLKSQFNAAIKNLEGQKVKIQIDDSSINSEAASIGKKITSGIDAKAKIDIDVNQSAARRNVDRYLNNIKNRIGKFAPDIDMDIGVKDIKEFNALTKTLQNRMQQIANIDISKGFNTNSLNELNNQLKKYMVRWSQSAEEFATGDVARKMALDFEQVQDKLSFANAKSVDLGYADAVNKEAAEVKVAINELKAALKQIDSLQRQRVKLDVNSNEYAAISAEINRLMQRATELQSKLSGDIPDSVFDSIAEDSAKARAELERMIAKLDDARRKRADAFSTKINNGTFNAELEKLDTRIDKLTNKTPGLNLAYEQLTKLRSEFGKVYSEYQQTGNVDSLIKFQDKYNAALTATKNQLIDVEEQQKRVNSEIRKQANLTKLESSKQTFDLQIQSWLKSNSAAAADFGDRLNDIRARIKDCNDSASLNNLKSEFQQVKLEAQIADKATMTFGDRLKNQLREYASYVGIAGVFMAGSQAVRMMAQNVLEVDTAMTGLYRVTDMTAAQYDKLYSDMIASSKEYGTTLTDTINATSDWVRAGYDADTALQLADVTAMYQHISDLDYDEASKNLLTAYNGFKDSFNEEFGGDVVASVNHIADAFNDLDNKYSITSAGLGEGLARSASALQLAGNTFEEAAAMIGAAGEVTQDPTRVGTAMRTLSLRIRGELYNTPPYSESYKLCYVA